MVGGVYRVGGIGSEYAELLEKAGVDTVKELRTRNAANLAERVREVNSGRRRLVRALPQRKTHCCLDRRGPEPESPSDSLARFKRR